MTRCNWQDTVVDELHLLQRHWRAGIAAAGDPGRALRRLSSIRKPSSNLAETLLSRLDRWNSRAVRPAERAGIHGQWQELNRIGEPHSVPNPAGTTSRPLLRDATDLTT